MFLFVISICLIPRVFSDVQTQEVVIPRASAEEVTTNDRLLEDDDFKPAIIGSFLFDPLKKTFGHPLDSSESFSNGTLVPDATEPNLPEISTDEPPASPPDELETSTPAPDEAETSSPTLEEEGETVTSTAKPEEDDGINTPDDTEAPPEKKRALAYQAIKTTAHKMQGIFRIPTTKIFKSRKSADKRNTKAPKRKSVGRRWLEWLGTNFLGINNTSVPTDTPTTLTTVGVTNAYLDYEEKYARMKEKLMKILHHKKKLRQHLKSLLVRNQVLNTMAAY